MGSNTSKSYNEPVARTQKNDQVDINPDPRSPTPEITRTPLQSKTGTKHNITKNVDLRKTFENAKDEEKLIHNNPILSAVIKNHLQSYDPRSPTQDFERTPIIIASKIDELTNDKQMLRHQSENNCASPCLTNDKDEHNNSYVKVEELNPDLLVPKNLCDGFFDMTLNDTEEPLGSSTASNEGIEKYITIKPKQLLETNFDFVESDVDKFEDSEEYVHETDLDKKENKINISQFKILDNDPRSPSVGIERTPIVVAKIEEESGEDNVEEMSDDTLIKVLQSTNAELLQTVTRSQDNNSAGLLIYEDEVANPNSTPKKPRSASNSGSRTPLSCMKNKTDTGHARSKSVNTLYDPKRQKVAQSKIPKRVSHIPRLKSLTNQTKLNLSGSSVSLKNISKTSAISGDCENTPPHSHRDMWDKDNSIVL